MSQPIAKEVYVTLAGTIDTQLVQRAFTAISVAVNNQVGKVHLLIQSTGGQVDDGISLYNYLRNLPFELITYNCGSVASVAVVVFLAGYVRRASATAQFAIHKTSVAVPHGATATQLWKRRVQSGEVGSGS